MGTAVQSSAPSSAPVSWVSGSADSIGWKEWVENVSGSPALSPGEPNQRPFDDAHSLTVLKV